MSNVVTTLLKNEISAHVMASSYSGTAFLSSTGICMTNSRRPEGEQISGASSTTKSETVQSSKFNAYNRKKGDQPSNRGNGARIRKNLIRNRCEAFARLDRSKKFIAFYTVTFPKGMTDDQCFSCLNKWLTRIRKWRIRFPYLWVAERQKNGTIHYHLLTNAFLPIKVVNGFMGMAIRNELKKDSRSAVNFNYRIYNGVDVTRVQSPKRVTKYITKYLTKELTDQISQKWHCSRVFSQLTVSLTVHAADAHYMISVLKRHQLADNESIIAISNDFFLYLPLKHGPPEQFRKEIYSGNNQRFEQWSKS